MWGCNESGQLGEKGSGKGGVPIVLKDIKASHVSLGHTHTLAIDKISSLLYGWGSNAFGEAIGEVDPSSPSKIEKPTLVKGGLKAGEKVVSCAAGVRHSAAVIENGEILMSGRKCDPWGTSNDAWPSMCLD